MTRVRSPGTWNDGTAVPGTEFEALDQGQHTAIKWGDGAVYTMTLNPLTIAGTALRVAGDGLKLDSADGPTYSGGMAMAPLKKEFILQPAWKVPSGETPWSWDAGGFVAAQRSNDNLYVMCTLPLLHWHKQKLRRLRLRVKGGTGHTNGNVASMTKPRFALIKHHIMSSNVDDILGLIDALAGPWYNDASTTAAGYEAVHWIDTGADAINVTLDSYEYYYSVFVQGEYGSGSLTEPNFLCFAVAATFDISTKPFG